MSCEHRNTTSTAVVENREVVKVIVRCTDCGHKWEHLT